MKLVNMQITEKPSQDPCCAPCFPEAPKYPYGLQLRLCEEDLKKLGVTALPPMGAVITIQAKAVVCAASERKNLMGTDRSLELQITELGFAEDEGASDQPGDAKTEGGEGY